MKTASIKIVSLFLLVLTVNSCRKTEFDERTPNRFIATYDYLGIGQTSPGYVFNLCSAMETSTGELVTVSYSILPPDRYIVVLKTDAEGNPLWTKQYPGLRLAGNNIWNIIELADGSFFISSRMVDEILRITKDGEVIYHTTFVDDWVVPGKSNLEYVSMPLIEEDGTLYLSASYHRQGGIPAKCIMVSINEIGEAETIQEFTDRTILGSIYFLNVVKVDRKKDIAYYINSFNAEIVKDKFVFFSGFSILPNDIPTNPDDTTISWYLASPEQDLDDHISIVPAYQLGGQQRDGDEVTSLHDTYSGFGSYQNSVNPIRFSRVSLSRSHLPEVRTYNNANYSYKANSFTKSKNGGYYICGTVNLGLASAGSFLIKLNNNLDIVYEKYDFDPNFRFNQISECKDGSLLICGYVNDMGQGDDTKKRRYLLCRLNPDGSL